MIICFTSEKDNLNSLLSSRFEESPYFIFFDPENEDLEILKHQQGLLNGLEAAHLVADRRPDLVITGNIGPAAFDFLKASGIKIASGIFGLSVKEALNRYQEGKIKEVKQIFGAGKGRLI